MSPMSPMSPRSTPLVRFYDDAADFLAVAAGAIAADPVRHTVLATAAAQVARGARTEPYCWFATVEDAEGDPSGRAPLGLAMRTHPGPPHPPHLSAMAQGHAVALADALLDRGEPVHAGAGARAATEAFAARVAERVGGRVEVALHTRLFELSSLVAPAPVGGRLREVRPDEDERALEWCSAFFADADAQAGRSAGHGGRAVAMSLAEVARRRGDGVLWFWVDAEGRPVHLIGARAPAQGVTRIAPVYTPRELRGRGFAGAAVAEVARRFVERGVRVALFTDQANPVSNALYLRLGFEPVDDAVELLVSW